MNENEKDFMEQLTGLDDSAVEEIAEKYPALDENAKKRILKQSLRKSGFPDDDISVEEPEEEQQEEEETEIIDESDMEDEISVSGIEQYNNKISWHKYAGSAAALIIAVVGISSVVLLHRNMNDNDDFDISTPPFIETSYSEPEQITEIVSGSYIDKGYRAGGFDYANVNGYEGSIQYGMTTATEPHEVITETVFTTAPPVTVPETIAENSVYEEIPPVEDDNHDEPVVTEAPATNPPATTAPLVDVAVTTTITTAVTVTSESTEPTSAESHKTFLDGMRYVEISGTGEYMGFEFRPDGTLTTYSFDKYGNIVDGTSIILDYEFIENSFSFGDIKNGLNWKKGIVINANDSGSFTVQFDDKVYTFSTEPPVFAELEVSIEGVWRTSGNDVERIFTFHENTMNGSYITADDNAEINFTYERTGNDITFHFDTGETAKAVVNGSSIISVFDFEWSDGRTEHFYSFAT
ncbi:MAG: hypothetical protein K2K89_13530 [Ruminococcus sp.]|nr:hypothetical protein [Ruminococcus sp.]